MEEASRVIDPEEQMPWSILASLALSVLIIFGGMFWTYSIWKQSNQAFHELHHVQETVQGLRAKVQVREARL